MCLVLAVALLQVLIDQKLSDGQVTVRLRPLVPQVLQKLLPLLLVSSCLPRQSDHRLQQRQQERVGSVRWRRRWEGLIDQKAEGVVTVVPSLVQLLRLLETVQQPRQREQPMRRGRRLVAVVTGPAQFDLEPLGIEQRPQRIPGTPRPREKNRNKVTF